MNTIVERLQKTRAHIADLATKNQRKAKEIQILAVSKTKPTTDIIKAYEAGQRQFGENYLQESLEKISALASYEDIEWHFIGPIQSNKTKPIAEHFNWVLSVDRLKLVTRLSNQRPPDMPPLNVCIQVNISDESSKSGATLNDVPTLAAAIHDADQLTLRGLMAVPAKLTGAENDQNQFLKMKSLFDELKKQYPTIDTLSMGMSNDADIAVKYGSTMVRIGTAIFGARN